VKKRADPEIRYITTPPTPFCTVEKAAEMLGMSVDWVRKATRNGTLPIIERKNGQCTLMIDMIETYRRVQEGQLVIIPSRDSGE